jgi:hypothetical protein
MDTITKIFNNEKITKNNKPKVKEITLEKKPDGYKNINSSSIIQIPTYISTSNNY